MAELDMNIPEYALTKFWIYLRFYIWQCSEYTRVTQGSKYTAICLDMS